MKEIKIDFQTVVLRYDRKLKEYVAEFTEEELMDFVKKVRGIQKGVDLGIVVSSGQDRG